MYWSEVDFLSSQNGRHLLGFAYVIIMAMRVATALHT
jgi:hypothetical protein